VILAWLSSAPVRAEQTLPDGPAEPPTADRALQLDLPADIRRRDASPDGWSDPVTAGGQDDERPWHDSGYGWKTAPPDTPDWPGARRDTSYFLVYQLAVIGVLYLMPDSVTNWDKDDIEAGRLADKWWDNLTHPEWDEDDWWINYLAHPYWGATYYIRGRERGLDRPRSFLYSALLSTLYETTFEAVAEPVSYQDLIVTPVLGALVGEYVFGPLRERIRARPGTPSWSDKTVLFLTDPLGVMSSWTDRRRGVETRLTMQRVGGRGLRPASAYDDSESPRRGTLTAQNAWPLGIQREVRW
jgi:hypothetical protein